MPKETPGKLLAPAEYSLYHHLRSIQEEHGLEAMAVSFHDYETGISWSWRGDDWFHAASTMKLAVLLALFREIDRRELTLSDPVHVRNRFRSIVDGAPFKLEIGDQDAGIAPFLGRTVTVRALADAMITTSSNLATNLLVDAVGVAGIRETLEYFRIRGVKVLRGVEDQNAFEAGLSNEVTANGLLQLLRLLAEKGAYSPEASDEMLDILFRQRYRGGIPAGLPRAARVAHKTGNIRTVDHDAGIVYLGTREPYVLVVLTQFTSDTDSGSAVADISQGIYESLAALGSQSEEAARG